MSNGNAKLSTQLSHRSHVLGLRLWQIIALALGALTVVVLFLLALRLRALRWTSKSRKQKLHPDFINNSPIPIISKEIKEVQVTDGTLSLHPHIVAHPEPASVYRLPIPSVGRVSSWGQRSTSTVDILDDEKQVVTFAYEGDMDVNVRDFQSITNPKLAAAEAPEMQQSPIIKHNAVAEIGSNFSRMNERTEPLAITITECEFASVSVGSSTHNISYDECQLYWAGCKGKRYSIEELEHATDQFAEGNILGKGGYGVVYQGLLYDGSVVAVKHLINVSRNPSEEFTVEVEAISCVRHKNLVGLLGYCAQGPHRLLVYEYVDNGNLEQWLHGPLGTSQPIPWNRRMNIVLGTAKGLAYLHEDLEPKVVHRDVKASNILLDSSWNAKISDFGLAKLLGDGKSHVTTRVMGTFGYVAPEYASTGLLTESSDVYSFGVLMMEVITGRDPVDYSRPAREMNVVDWTKRMVESKRWEDVADPQLPEKPSGRALKRALLVALRCVDPDAQRRPRMGQIVYMLEADDISFHHVCNNRRKVEGHVKGRSFRQADRPDSRGQKDSFHY